MMQKMHDPVIEGNYNVTGYMRVIPTMGHKDDKIQWTCGTSISTDVGEHETPKEAIMRLNGNLWKMSAISEVNIFYIERPGF